jgi:DNA-binding NarL/FixJ family response regulator
MQALSVVLLQSDSRIAQSLVKSLCGSFHSVHTVRSLGELRISIAKHRAKVVVLDIETASIAEVERLSRDFPGISIVCTHRLADEEMWTAALGAGAADICPSSDAQAVLTSALRNVAPARGFAA